MNLWKWSDCRANDTHGHTHISASVHILFQNIILCASPSFLKKISVLPLGSRVCQTDTVQPELCIYLHQGLQQIKLTIRLESIPVGTNGGPCWASLRAGMGRYCASLPAIIES